MDSLKHRLVKELIPCNTQPCQRTDSQKHKRISDLILSTSTSSANWIGEAQTSQQTDSLHHRFITISVPMSLTTNPNNFLDLTPNEHFVGLISKILF